MNKEYEVKPFEKFNTALLTAGTKDNFNSMTIGWANIGVTWGKNTIVIYVRESRYTLEFLKNNDYFSISILKPEYKKAYGIMGTKSGRDVNKVELTGLIPKEVDNVITYEEAEETFVCKKIYFQQMDKSCMSKELLDNYAENEGAHYIIIGEIANIEK